MSEQDFYLRYYVGHKGRFGHEFLEFELLPSGMLRYANNSNYKHESLIRKELCVKRIVLEEAARMCREAGVVAAPETAPMDDREWPMADRDGRQELEVICGDEHVFLETGKIASLLDIQKVGDPPGLRQFHYLVQDLRTLVLSLVSVHFKIKPI